MRQAGRGRIVNIASVAGVKPTGSSIAYASSKAALIHLTRCLAVALAPAITVNCVAPGLVEGTRMAQRIPPEVVDQVRRDAVLQRAAEADDIAHQVLTFCRADTVTGQTVVIDGGLLLPLATWQDEILAAVVAVACLAGVARAGDTTPVVPLGKSSFEFIDHRGDPSAARHCLDVHPGRLPAGLPAPVCLSRGGAQWRGVPRQLDRVGQGAALHGRGRGVLSPTLSEGRRLQPWTCRRRARSQEVGVCAARSSLRLSRGPSEPPRGHVPGVRPFRMEHSSSTRWLLFRPRRSRKHRQSRPMPGWYTMPSWDPEKTTFSFPFSLVGSPIGQPQLKEALSRRFVLMWSRCRTPAPTR